MEDMDSYFMKWREWRSKTILKSQDSMSNAVEAVQEGLVLVVTEQFERSTIDFL